MNVRHYIIRMRGTCSCEEIGDRQRAGRIMVHVRKKALPSDAVQSGWALPRANYIWRSPVHSMLVVLSRITVLKLYLEALHTPNACNVGNEPNEREDRAAIYINSVRLPSIIYNLNSCNLLLLRNDGAEKLL